MDQVHKFFYCIQHGCVTTLKYLFLYLGFLNLLNLLLAFIVAFNRDFGDFGIHCNRIIC